jgi:hypothetical protein
MRIPSASSLVGAVNLHAIRPYLLGNRRSIGVGIEAEFDLLFAEHMRRIVLGPDDDDW